MDKRGGYFYEVYLFVRGATLLGMSEIFFQMILLFVLIGLLLAVLVAKKV